MAKISEAVLVDMEATIKNVKDSIDALKLVERSDERETLDMNILAAIYKMGQLIRALGGDPANL